MNEIFEGLEHFESTEPARRSSPDIDYGFHWRLTGWTGSWRVSYVRDTGEVYALHGGQKQGWHDHIASTYVIRAPGRRGRPARLR